MQLHNFYAFVPLQPDEALKELLRAKGKELGILGTVLLAREGINAALCGDEKNLRAFLSFLEKTLGAPSLNPFVTELGEGAQPPFHKFKVRVKPEIVALGMPDLNPGDAACPIGTHVSPREWNEIIVDPTVLVLDMRNTYEYCVGHFKNAVNPDTHVFKEFPDYVARTWGGKAPQAVAMYCTGGIRCEKASAFLKANNFPVVYQLRGGILEYFRDIPEEESLWLGGCFVFDDRVVIGREMNPLPVSFDDIPHAMEEYRNSSGHGNHIYTKILHRISDRQHAG